MGSIKTTAWRKSYMLEFLKGTNVEKVFTFSVPPESEEFTYNQRLVETKTFGGSIFEDFGADSYSISLNGSTINENKKTIYRGHKEQPAYLSGTGEIQELKDFIDKWNENDSEDKKIYLYDLSKNSTVNVVSNLMNKNYWRVYIKDLKVKRDKSNPYAYKYTLDMVGMTDDEHAKTQSKFTSKVEGLVNKINATTEKIQKVADTTQAITQGFRDVTSDLNHVQKAFETLSNRNAGEIVQVLATNVTDKSFRILGGDNENVFNMVKNLLDSVKNLKGLVL